MRRARGCSGGLPYHAAAAVAGRAEHAEAAPERGGVPVRGVQVEDRRHSALLLLWAGGGPRGSRKTLASPGASWKAAVYFCVIPPPGSSREQRPAHLGAVVGERVAVAGVLGAVTRVHCELVLGCVAAERHHLP